MIIRTLLNTRPLGKERNCILVVLINYSIVEKRNGVAYWSRTDEVEYLVEAI